MIVVERAPPYLTVQDAGRAGYRASGVPRSGAMDQWSLALGNLLVGNHRGAAALEWAIGGGSLRFESDTLIALAGASAEASIDGENVTENGPIFVRAGQVLTVTRLTARRFLYVAVKGGIDCPIVLGSRSTYTPATFGGILGRRLAKGDALGIGSGTAGRPVGLRTIESAGVGPDFESELIRVVVAESAAEGIAEESAPSRSSGTPSSIGVDAFFQASYSVSSASDRTGYRLEPDRPLEGLGGSITSEPICSGVIQLPPEGRPVVLMADSPTIGGYRILGTVISCDLPTLAQCMPGRKIRFMRIPVGDAQEELRRREDALSKLERDSSAAPSVRA